MATRKRKRRRPRARATARANPRGAPLPVYEYGWARHGLELGTATSSDGAKKLVAPIAAGRRVTVTKHAAPLGSPYLRAFMVRFAGEPARANPALTIFANPRAKRGRHELVSRAVREIWYVHADDGKLYRHDFAAGVCAERLPDGSARLYRPDGKQVLKHFPD